MTKTIQHYSPGQWLHFLISGHFNTPLENAQPQTILSLSSQTLLDAFNFLPKQMLLPFRSYPDIKYVNFTIPQTNGQMDRLCHAPQSTETEIYQHHTVRASVGSLLNFLTHSPVSLSIFLSLFYQLNDLQSWQALSRREVNQDWNREDPGAWRQRCGVQSGELAPMCRLFTPVGGCQHRLARHRSRFQRSLRQ